MTIRSSIAKGPTLRYLTVITTIFLSSSDESVSIMFLFTNQPPIDKFSWQNNDQVVANGSKNEWFIADYHSS